jgi:hypothetical protein
MVEIFPVELVPGEAAYCPYCDGFPLQDMRDEHVFPQSIGGDSRTVIRVCFDCNSNAGSRIDSLLSRHSALRAISLVQGSLMNRLERHESTGVLKDGRRLEGHFYLSKVGPNEAKIGFEPKKKQLDGSLWLSEHSTKDNDAAALADKGINIYRDQDLDKASFTFAPPGDAGIEPAIIKILLGISYMIRGQKAVSLPGFDVMRNCLTGVLDSRVRVTWLDSLESLASRMPLDVQFGEHTVWGECADGQTFLGGVSLFGKVIAEVQISEFGAMLEGRCASFGNPRVKP